MAKNYVLFSEAIYKLTNEERTWCEKRLQHLQQVPPTLDDECKDENGVPAHPKMRHSFKNLIFVFAPMNTSR
ncbi:MAG: hypothetical protein L0226_13695 [Acidobacteria bacterium]|nr:hypothetical protein [Acidobacteriota bacterium]